MRRRLRLTPKAGDSLKKSVQSMFYDGPSFVATAFAVQARTLASGWRTTAPCGPPWRKTKARKFNPPGWVRWRGLAGRRMVTCRLHEEALEWMNARLKADPGLIRQRRCAAEHPFGTIKRKTAGGRRSPAKPLSVCSPQPRRRQHPTGKARLTENRLLRQQKRGPGNPEPLTFRTACVRRPSLRLRD
jgi:hypothetical protein